MKSSTSSLAMIEAWNLTQQRRHPELSLIGWTDYYIPSHMVFVRPLSSEERARYGDGLDEGLIVVYGAFMARTGYLLSASGDMYALRRHLIERRYLVTFIQ